MARSDNVAACGPELGQCTCFSRILDVNGNSRCSCQGLTQIHVAPGKCWSMQTTSAGWIDHAGHNYANAFAGTDLFVVGQNLLNAPRKLGNQNVDISVCLKTADY